MRLYSLRSFIFLGMALAASALVFAAPASAVPIDHGLYAVHADAGKAVHDFHVAVISDQAQREAALFLNSDPVPSSAAARTASERRSTCGPNMQRATPPTACRSSISDGAAKAP
jgi:hypothetical protein